MKTLSLILIASSLSSIAFADNFRGYYDGPRVDVNFIYQKPDRFPHCKQTYMQASAREMSACEDGRETAENLASRYAGDNGRVEGYLRGMAWGLNKMTRAYENDAAEMDRAARTLNGPIVKAAEVGRDVGSREGAAAGRQEVIRRFNAAVNSGNIPNANVQVNVPSYDGESNAYAKYVGDIPTVNQIIRNELNLGQVRIYSDVNSSFLGDRKRYTWYDMWSDNGTYRFENGNWMDPKEAWSFWRQQPSTSQSNYLNLNIPPLTHQEKKMEHQAPVANIDGSTTPMPDREVIVDVVTDLKPIFEDGFKRSYGYYVNYYFSSNFSSSLDQGQREGEEVGKQVGKRVAYYNGYAAEFNRQFKDQSRNAYGEAYKIAFYKAFNDAYNVYVNNSVINVELTKIVGQVNDGILQPGEAVALEFVVTNSGAKPTNFKAFPQGSLENATSNNYSIAALTKQSFTTGVVGTIDNRLKARETARVNLVLDVNGTQFSDSLSEQVRKLVELDSIQPRLVFVEGKVQATVRILNTSTVRSPADVTVEVKINGVSKTTANLGVLEAGAKQEAFVNVENLDPLQILGNALTATYVVRMNNTEIAQYSESLGVPDKSTAVIDYWHALQFDTAYVPLGGSKATLVEKMKNQILELNAAEISYADKQDENLWKKNLDSTVVGKLIKSRSRALSNPAVIEAYHKLGDTLYSARKTFKGGFIGFDSFKRNSYEDKVQKLSKKGKY